jgi:ATP-binding protein involved in chromosome partitioning
MSSILLPREIKRRGTDGLDITWSDGEVQGLSSTTLRQLCPCAECKEKRGDSSHAKPLSPKKRALRIVESSIDEELRLTQVWAVGNYAIGMRWGDGHDSGIYTFEYLRSL